MSMDKRVPVVAHHEDDPPQGRILVVAREMYGRFKKEVLDFLRAIKTTP